MHSVMLADDERPARELLKLLINWEEAGFFVVCEASDGKAALRKFHIYDPDLIIADIQMPAMDGLALMRSIREKKPEQLFIVLSCHELFEYARTAFKLGACDYLVKDSLTQGELLNALNKAKELLPPQEAFQSVSEHFKGIADYSPRIRRVAEYMLQNYDKDISLSSLAEMFDIHKVYLARTFKEETGASIHEVILELRLEKAKLLLSDPELKVSEVIEQVGFHNPQNFYTLFKKYTGISPSKYRSMTN